MKRECRPSHVSPSRLLAGVVLAAAAVLAPALLHARDAKPPPAEPPPPESLHMELVQAKAVSAEGRVRLLEGPHGQMYLLTTQALLRLEAGKLSAVLPVAAGDDAAFRPDGRVVHASGEDVRVLALTAPGAAKSVAGELGPLEPGNKVLFRAPDGSVWVQGAEKRLAPDGNVVAGLDVTEARGGLFPPACDIAGNAWLLIPQAPGARERALALLPAQKPGAWVRDTLSRLEPGDWRFLVADDCGCLWIASDKALQRLECRDPAKGWTTIPARDLPGGEITALARAPHGGVVAGSSTGEQVEYVPERDGKLRLRRLAPPDGVAGAVRAQWTDAGGVLWAVIGTALVRVELPAGSALRNWRATGRLPFGNHDLTGAELEGRFYIAGGLNGAFGCPGQPYIADMLLAFDPKFEIWVPAGRLACPRKYCAVAAFAGQVWVIGGEVVKDGKSALTATVECFSPKTRNFISGPPLRDARPMAVAGVLNGRLYVAGDAVGAEGDTSPLESIGPDDGTWRAEPAAPLRLNALAACVLDASLYVCVPGRGLVAFDAATGKWNVDLPKPPQPPRSPQMAGFRGEVWLLGGRDMPRGTDVQCYDPRTRTWRAGPSLPMDSAWGAAGVLDGRLLVVGGAREAARKTFTFSPLTFWLAAGTDR